MTLTRQPIQRPQNPRLSTSVMRLKMPLPQKVLNQPVLRSQLEQKMKSLTLPKLSGLQNRQVLRRRLTNRLRSMVPKRLIRSRRGRKRKPDLMRILKTWPNS